MHRLLHDNFWFLHDNFWFYVIVIGILFGAVFYLPPMLANLLDRIGGGRSQKARVKNYEPDKIIKNNNRRYKTF